VWVGSLSFGDARLLYWA